VAIAFALAAVYSAAALAGPAAKPKACKAGKVRVTLNGKPKCVPASTLGSAAPGVNAADKRSGLAAPTPPSTRPWARVARGS
jgi:hypothetical protein